MKCGLEKVYYKLPNGNCKILGTQKRYNYSINIFVHLSNDIILYFRFYWLHKITQIFSSCSCFFSYGIICQMPTVSVILFLFIFRTQ